ncbi:SGS-domain-containing protein [Hypoxylon sp. FL0890]|nr:SGS-domain-containing protein [Hypoxylon sp. FL0890]
MSASSAVLADQGVKAVNAGKYEEGIEKLTGALKERPAPLWLLERSKAYLRTNELDLALRDAELALQVAFQRANRDQMIEAQIRRAITLFRLGRFADADICAFWAIRLLDKAKATEDDGQEKKVDANGEYIVHASEVTDANQPDKSQGLATAMGSTGGRSKATTLRNQAFSWRLQALTQLEKLPAGHSGRKVNIAEKYPTEASLSANGKHKPVSPTEADDDNDADSEEVGTKDGRAAPKDSQGLKLDPEQLTILYKRFTAAYAANSIRSSFYQTESTINADFFVKNVPSDRFSLTAESQKIIMGPIPNIHPGSIQLHLWGKIKPAETKYTVKSMKIELVLQKETPGKWPMLQREGAEGFTNIAGSTKVPPSLEAFKAFLSRLGLDNPEDVGLRDERDHNAWYSDLIDKFQAGLAESKVSAAKSSEIPNTATEATSVSSGVNATTLPTGGLTQASNPTVQPTPTANKADAAKPAGSAQAYPTSSKKGAVNWDKIADGDDDEEKGGDVNTFFQKLYKDADDDTRRAMMKSYVESNGTSLSTNWAEAKDKTYKTQPPDGAEARKWDE